MKLFQLLTILLVGIVALSPQKANSRDPDVERTTTVTTHLALETESSQTTNTPTTNSIATGIPVTKPPGQSSTDQLIACREKTPSQHDQCTTVTLKKKDHCKRTLSVKEDKLKICLNILQKNGEWFTIYSKPESAHIASGKGCNCARDCYLVTFKLNKGLLSKHFCFDELDEEVQQAITGILKPTESPQTTNTPTTSSTATEIPVKPPTLPDLPTIGFGKIAGAISAIILGILTIVVVAWRYGCRSNKTTNYNCLTIKRNNTKEQEGGAKVAFSADK